MKKICVFCGSSMGNQKVYKEEAKKLAEFFIDKDISMVYGGANVGLMKILADTMIQADKEVIGVMPKHLVNNEVAHTGLTDFIEVESMAERKDLMIQMSDAFIALPGGFGTLDEVAEVLVLDQLHVIEKPMGLLNTNHYFDDLYKFFEKGVDQGFVRQEHLDNLFVSNKIEDLYKKMSMYQPIGMNKWLKDIKTESK